jgi:protein-tyrosine-phosphatase
MPSILFVCTGNQYRSPIAAEAFRQQLARDGRAAQWTVNSAGTWTMPGQPVFPESVELAGLFGVDIAGHTTREVDAKLLEESDLVLVMEAGHKESILIEFPSARKKVYLLAEVVDGRAYDIPDPARAGENPRDIIRDLVAMVRAGSEKIYQMGESASLGKTPAS